MSIGGGYVAIPLIKNQVVEQHKWLTISEFTDLISIAEMTPGPIALNSATFVGIRVAGIPGALVATFGCILPSCVIVIILARLYVKYREMKALRHILSGLRPAVVAMIASAGLSIIFLAFFQSGTFSTAITDLKFISIAIFAAAIFVLRKWRLNPIYVMAATGAVGLLVYSLV